MAVKHIPEGYHTLTPMLVIDGAGEALEFYKRAFGAKEKYRLPMGDKVGHAEMTIGDSHFMLGDEMPEMDMVGPKKRGGTSMSLLIYSEDVDAAFKRALEAGAKEERPVRNEFWGDRIGTLVDPFGHRWSIATHVEEVSEEEIKRRMDAWVQSQGST